LRVLNTTRDRNVMPEERAAQPLAGGIAQHGYQCGMLWGSALAAGAEAHRRYGACPEAEARAVLAARRLVRLFRTQNGHTDCFDITDIDHHSSTLKMIKVFLIQGKTVGCLRMAGRFAPAAAREIEAAMSEPLADTCAAPVSCAAELARKLGGTERHAGMVAGLAGGLGLSGGACGALGGAVWLDALVALRRGGKMTFKPLRALDLISRFMRITEGGIECSAVAGRSFASVREHADFVRGGGCSRLIESLAAAIGGV
jgi:hypothetical protein